MKPGSTSGGASLPDELEVIIEVPRFGFVKRDERGRIDYISPLPSPFNYGSVPDSRADDGEREDALVLGKALPRGTRLRVPVVAQVRFVDAGVADPKWVCSTQPLTAAERMMVVAFFALYARGKDAGNRLRGRGSPTRYAGLVLR